MYRFLLCLLTAGFLVACATPPLITPENVVSIKAKESSAIMMATESLSVCNAASIGVLNQDNGIIYYLYSHGKSLGYRGVPAGTYRIHSGSCFAYNVTGNYPLLGLWFKPVEVKPGEIVNLGMLKNEILDMKSKPGSEAGQVWNFLTSLSANDKSQYVVYSMDGSNEQWVKNLLKEDFPELGTEFSTKIPVRSFTEDEFKSAVEKAYEPDETGAYPETNIARKRLTTNLLTLVLEKSRTENTK